MCPLSYLEREISPHNLFSLNGTNVIISATHSVTSPISCSFWPSLVILLKNVICAQR